MLSEDKVCRIEIVTQGILSDIYLHAYYYMYLLHHIVRDLTKNDKYCISSNNSLGRLIFFFSHQKGAIIQGGRLFQIFLTEGPALNILFYYTIKSKKLITSNITEPNMGF